MPSLEARRGSLDRNADPLDAAAELAHPPPAILAVFAGADVAVDFELEDPTRIVMPRRPRRVVPAILAIVGQITVVVTAQSIQTASTRCGRPNIGESTDRGYRDSGMGRTPNTE